VTDQAPPGAAPSQPAAASAASDADRMGAMGLASMVVGVIASGVVKRWPATAYTDKEKETLSIVLAPLFMKWGFNAAWFQRWREEATALGVVAQLALVGYQRVQAAPPPKPAGEGDPTAA